MRDDDNDFLALDGLEDDPMLQIHGYSITYRIATGKQQGRKVFRIKGVVVKLKLSVSFKGLIDAHLTPVNKKRLIFR